MINIDVKRHRFEKDYTEGQMFLNNMFFGYTLEDTVRDLTKEAKVPGKTAIPSGEYEIIVNFSPKFKRNLPRLINVPYFDGILIHRGNTSEDTSGCILVGKSVSNGYLSESTPVEEELTKILLDAQDRGEKIIIKIY